MAEGRKMADEMKKEQSANAKKMKIGGVETEVTLKSNINQGRGIRDSSYTKINDFANNGAGKSLPYLPFPVSALPKEAMEHIMPCQRGKKQKSTVVRKEETTQSATFDIDGYKQYNYAKLPDGGLCALKQNFLNTFCKGNNDSSVSKPAQKLSLKVNEITNTILTRKSTTSLSRSRKSFVKGQETSTENQDFLSGNPKAADCSKLKVYPNIFVSLKGKSIIPPESEMQKLIDLSHPKLKFEHLPVINFLLSKPKYAKEDKTKAKQLCKFLMDNSEFEKGMSSYHDSVEKASNGGNGFLVSSEKKNKRTDTIYTSGQCTLALQYLKSKTKEITSGQLKKFEAELINDQDVDLFLTTLMKSNAHHNSQIKIKSSNHKSNISYSHANGITDDANLPKEILSNKKADEIIDLIPIEERHHVVEDSESKLAIERSPLLSTLWHRVILDEAHRIKSRVTSTCQAALQLKAKKRWCVSGTPLQNRIGELFSLIPFIQFYPYSLYFCEKKGCGCCVLDWSFGLNFFCNKCNHAKSMHRNYFQKHVTLPLNKYGNNLGAGKKAMKLLQSSVLSRIVLRRTKVCIISLTSPNLTNCNR